MAIRYSVIKNPTGRIRVGGYAIHDATPTPIEAEDIEGVGLVRWNTPKPGNSVIGWYRRKLDAQAQAENLNRWSTRKN